MTQIDVEVIAVAEESLLDLQGLAEKEAGAAKQEAKPIAEQLADLGIPEPPPGYDAAMQALKSLVSKADGPKSKSGDGDSPNEGESLHANCSHSHHDNCQHHHHTHHHHHHQHDHSCAHHGHGTS